MEAILPPGWSWPGQRVLDFGCGTGKVLCHFADEANEAEFWGCDIDRPSIEWVQRNMCPPFRAFECREGASLPQPDGYFDLIFAWSVYTHITDRWAEWLLEHHRVLADDGLLLASFIGEGMVEHLTSEEWCEDRIGMNILNEGNPWDCGGPTVIHSPWWLRAHWGRAFEILDLWPSVSPPRRPTADDAPTPTHGMILLRRKPVRLTVRDLTRLEPDEPREISSLQHSVRQLRHQAAELRRQNAHLGGQLQAAHTDLTQRIGEIAELTQQVRMAEQNLRTAEEDLGRYRASLEAIQGSTSWRVTAPARAAKQHVKRLRT
ncbi:MAG: methyltransferase domain-containing protein [Solirubrobacterales bacterium]|nr:methyltransferase domain-containing protein [Solirubrobacterales bacterium]